MDNGIIIALVMFLGTLMGTLIPYALKVWKDSTVEFDINYGYALIMSMIVTVFGMLPDSVPVITVKIVVSAFLTGYGMQSLINKAVPSKVTP